MAPDFGLSVWSLGDTGAERMMGEVDPGVVFLASVIDIEWIE
jgi:hypothetical protein